MATVDKDKALDMGATGIGGGLGLDQIFEAIDALLKDGTNTQEWVMLVRGFVLIVLGFMAWRRAKREVGVSVSF
ncbi:MAG: hypothetical protein HQL97_00390 [Magnetococcales bacterium]|nr:hypothetical protein [Magnetococcales bacterium]